MPYIPPTTPDYPLLPLAEGEGDGLAQVFRNAAEQRAADEPSISSRPRTPPSAEVRARLLSLRGAMPPLQRRLHEAGGHPVRLGPYEVIRCIGAGGMGVVFEAVHVEHGHAVALKTRRAPTALGLARLKHEFRTLAGVAHPNLVSLFELGKDGDEWFFAMELVLGETFLDHVRECGVGRSSGDVAETQEEPVAAAAEPWGPVLGFHEGRLRATLGQLAAAIAELHARGLLHRDLNPGNVLVTREGRVVLLDFGLSLDHARNRARGGASGTPGYMSPEQGAGGPASPASDWYAFGVLLFEALTGQLPFAGSAARVLANKRQYDAPPASALEPGVPADLDALCAALLRKIPTERPDAAFVLRALGREAPLSGRAPLGKARFVGRQAELATLHTLLRRAEGEPTVVVLHGPSGSGKSALLSRFVEEVSRREGRAAPVVFSSASRARESIPHRLLDGVADAVSAHLGSHLPEAETAPFAGLYAAITNLAATRSVVIAIDDAHLGDVDDARLLAELAAPGVMVVVTHASEDLAASPVLAEISRRCGELHHVVLGPLAEDEAVALATCAGVTPFEARVIAAVSGGSPAGVEMLTRHAAVGDLAEDLRSATRARLDELGAAELRLLEVVASVPWAPDRGLLFAVAGAGAVSEPALASLEAKRFVRTQGVTSDDRVRLHDEALREAVVLRTLPERTRCIQLEVAGVLASRPEADPVEVAGFYARGGASELGANHLDIAATGAVGEGDLERAAFLWERALEFVDDGTPESRSLSQVRAEALAAAGRSMAAAAQYLEHMTGADRHEVLERRMRAAEHLLLSGHIEQGLGVLRPVLDEHGIAWPTAPEFALVALTAKLVPILLRGVSLPQDPSHWTKDDSADGGNRGPDPEVRARIEALWLAARGLSLVEPLRAALFVVDALAIARAAHDVEYATLALAFVGVLLAYRGSGREEARGTALIEEAARFARRTGDSYLLGFAWFCSGMARLCAGRFREALPRIDEGMRMLEARNSRLAWERTAYRAVSLQILFEQGSLAEMARRAERWLAEATSRDDHAGMAQTTLAVALAVLASGDPLRARAMIGEALARTWRTSFGTHHQMALWLEVSTFLYEGDTERAWARLRAAWPDLARSRLLRIQLVRIEALQLRAITAAALGGRALRIATADAELLERERRPHALAAAASARAAIADARGQIAATATHLAEAALAYASAEMKVHAACARRARGLLLGGAEGRALVAGADEVLGAEGVRDGARWAAMMTGIGVGRRGG
jgi:serine/threonine protein kinase